MQRCDILWDGQQVNYTLGCNKGSCIYIDKIGYRMLRGINDAMVLCACYTGECGDLGLTGRSRSCSDALMES